MLLCAIAAVVRQYRRLERERKPVREEVAFMRRVLLLALGAALIAAMLLVGSGGSAVAEKTEKKAVVPPPATTCGDPCFETDNNDRGNADEAPFVCDNRSGDRFTDLEFMEDPLLCGAVEAD
jgi:hypothetical protein